MSTTVKARFGTAELLRLAVMKLLDVMHTRGTDGYEEAYKPRALFKGDGVLRWAKSLQRIVIDVLPPGDPLLPAMKKFVLVLDGLPKDELLDVVKDMGWSEIKLVGRQQPHVLEEIYDRLADLTEAYSGGGLG